jgi:Multicopper oxidase
MLSEWKIEPGTKRRIRLGNLSAMADGGSISEAAQWPETTVLVPVGSIRTVEFIANNPADWAIHCHMTHHVMNQMGHRDFSYGGWYENPPGTQAISATEDELQRDLGGVPKSKRTRKPMHHSTTGEGKRDESLLAREALKTSNDCYLEPLRAGIDQPAA